MTDLQLYLAIGVPSLVALIGMLVNIGYFVALNGRMTTLETRFNPVAENGAGLNARVADVSQRIDDTSTHLGNRITDLNTKLDKVEANLKAHIDNAFEHMKLLLELHEAKHHKD